MLPSEDGAIRKLHGEVDFGQGTTMTFSFRCFAFLLIFLFVLLLQEAFKERPNFLHNLLWRRPGGWCHSQRTQFLNDSAGSPLVVLRIVNSSLQFPESSVLSACKKMLSSAEKECCFVSSSSFLLFVLLSSLSSLSVFPSLFLLVRCCCPRRGRYHWWGCLSACSGGLCWPLLLQLW